MKSIIQLSIDYACSGNRQLQQQLPAGELAYNLTQSETSETLAILDIAWPDGLQPGYSQPVALLLNEDGETEAIANQAGFRFFTDVDHFKTYVRHEILAIDDVAENIDENSTRNHSQASNQSEYTREYLIEQYPDCWDWVYQLAEYGEMSLGVRMGQGPENSALADAISKDAEVMKMQSKQDTSIEAQRDSALSSRHLLK